MALAVSWHLIAGAVISLAALGVVSVEQPHIRPLAVLAISAWSEEVVFRRVIPEIMQLGWRSRTARARLLHAYGVASLCFAVSHGALLIGRDASQAGMELARLTVGGMLYSAITVHVGLWAAVGMHAIMNYQLVTGAEVPSPVSLSLLVMAGIVACIAVVVHAEPAGSGDEAVSLH